MTGELPMAIREAPRFLDIPVLKISQPMGDFYTGSIDAEDLVRIADFDVRRIQQGEGLETYLGIQRELNQARVREIRQYVTGPDATFPTAVVLAVAERCVELRPACDQESSFFVLKLSNYVADGDEENWILYRQIARVIDGQHRIEGLRGYEGAPFQVNVSIFIGADLPDQATIFSTVNLAQTKVNRSLVYDLFDLARSKSPEKMAHNVAVALDRTEGSPFYKGVKRLGTSTPGRYGEGLSQATFVAPLLQYMSGDQMQTLKDRQAGRRGAKFEDLKQKWDRLVLRPFFLEDRDVDLADLIWNYFEAVSDKWPEAWLGNIEQGMLHRTNGFNALMRFFRPAYLSLSKPGELTSKEQFATIFNRIGLTSSDFTTRRFVPGTSGATDLYKELVAQSGLE